FLTTTFCTFKRILIQYAPALMEAQSAFLEAQGIFDHSDFYQRRGWKKEHETKDGYAVYSKNSNKGRIFTISEIVEASAADILRDSWRNNNPLMASEVIANLSDHAAVIRVGNAMNRQMTVARIFRSVEMSSASDGYIVAFKTVNLPDQPTNTAGMPTLHLGAIRLRPDPVGGGRARTFVDVVIILDLTGVADRAYAQQTASSMLTMLSEQAG
ncbi:hypothetical protein PMAYCL1PPCAC_16894, partial [Pristionchus mayeri]